MARDHRETNLPRRGTVGFSVGGNSIITNATVINAETGVRFSSPGGVIAGLRAVQVYDAVVDMKGGIASDITHAPPVAGFRGTEGAALFGVPEASRTKYPEIPIENRRTRRRRERVEKKSKRGRDDD